MKTGKCFIVFFIIANFFVACSNTRHLPDGDKLYRRTTVKVDEASSVKEKKVLQEDLAGLTRPKTNSRFLGIPFKLFIYNLFRNKKDSSFFGKIRDKNGEPPVLLSQLDLQTNIKLLQDHLENKGYFRATVTGDTIVRRKKAEVRYHADSGPQYKIAEVHFPDDSSALAMAMQKTIDKTLLQVGQPFDIDVIKAERSRIDAALKENGFYFFSPDLILVKADTTIGNHLVNMYVTVKSNTPAQSKEVYHIKKVLIYAGYSLNKAQADTNQTLGEYHKGYYIVDRTRRYKPRLFDETMKFKPGDIYNRTDHNLTLNRLSNLDLFKFVKNRFAVNASSDSALLDAYYYLTPMPKKSLSAELTTTTRSNNLNGSLVAVRWKDRNTFRGGEQLGVDLYAGSDIQFSGALKGYNAVRYGAEMNFTIPRFVVPFVNIANPGGYVPRTNIQLGYDLLTRTNLYTLNSFRTAYGYLCKKNIRTQHELYPISITYVQPMNITDAYHALIQQDTLLALAVQKQFIIGSTYQYNFNQSASGLQSTSMYYFNGLFDVSGNIAGWVTGANVKAGKEVTIGNVPFSQYVKLELDGRYYRSLGLHSKWANRLIIGIGIPYGNSIQLPFVKQFFIGGNNSLRGFRSRSVGPGTYKFPVPGNYAPDETGDLKLEMNTELRFRINGPLYGAVFLDAGNIWLVNDSSYTHKPGSQFTSQFLSQLAVDAGIGLRLDITLFVIRFDVAFPLRKPWEQNPWVLNRIRMLDGLWRQENVIYNLGIGYPF